MNIHQLLLKGYETLKSNNIESYIIDCQLLLGKVLNKDRLSIITNRDIEVKIEYCDEYFRLLELRKHNMPVKYILGETEFMGINLSVRPGVLIPRPDTEILVEEVLSYIKANSYKTVCDVCCGSGAIGLSIAYLNKDTEVQCYDISQVACEVTYENIEKLMLHPRAGVYKSDLLKKAIDEKVQFDVIVSNPPYIKEEVISSLMEDVKNYEPFIALCGGKDGLDFYRKITEQCMLTLNNGGLLAFEIGHDQKEEVRAILEEKGFQQICCKRDLAGNNRVITGIKNILK